MSEQDGMNGTAHEKSNGSAQAATIPHYVSREPFDPRAIEKLTPEQEEAVKSLAAVSL